MDSDTFEGTALPYILVKPEGYQPGAGFPLVILLHGFGASMYDLAGLASAIDNKGYVYAFPNAPYRVDLGYGSTGYSWMADRPGIEAPAAAAPTLRELLRSFMVEVQEQTGVQTGNAVIGGFSQGGGLALRAGLPYPEVFAGIAVLSGFFRDYEEAGRLLPPSRDQAIFMGHGRLDDRIPLHDALATRAFLEASGYHPEYHEYEIGHEISLPVVRDLTAWLHRVLPAKA